MICDPYACGSELTIADFYAHYCLGPAAGMARVAGVDLLSDSPMLVELLGRTAAHPSIERVTQEAARSRARSPGTGCLLLVLAANALDS